MLSYTELIKGVLFIMAGEPWEVLESHFLRMQQRKAVVQTKIKNLISGKIVDKNFQPSDALEEAEIEKVKSRFLYENRRVYWFDEKGNPKNRFSLGVEQIGGQSQFLKPNLEVTALKFSAEGGDKIINIELPVKADYEVTEAPPSIRGDTAQGGGKVITIETGAKISVPLFIEAGDIIRINTQTGEYVERIEKRE
jgi:elongation factor P